MSRFAAFFLSGAIFCLFLSQAAAQEAEAMHVLTFRDALRLAAAKNPDVIMTNERVKEALERLHEARSYLFPRISADISETRLTRNLETFGIDRGPAAPSVVGPFNVFDARIQLTQILFDLATVHRLESARIGADVSSAEFQKMKQDVLALVGTLYVEAMRAAQEAEFSKSAVRYAELDLRLARSHFALGTGSETDLKKAEWERAAGLSRLRSARSLAVSRLLDLKAAIGISQEESLRLSDKNLLFEKNLPRAADLRARSQAHPEVKLAEENFRVQKEQETVEKASYFPKVVAAADYGVNGHDPSDSTDTYDLGLELTWPIFEGGERQARIAEARSRAQEASTHLADVKNQKEIKAVQARNAMKDASFILWSKRQQLLWRQKELAIAVRRVQNGTASLLERLHARLAETDAQSESSEAAALYRMAQINLSHSLGAMEKFLEKE